MAKRDLDEEWSLLRDLYEETSAAVFWSVAAGLSLGVGLWVMLLLGGPFAGLPIRLVAVLLVAFILGGALAGLLVGVVLDAILSPLRPSESRKKRRPRRKRRPPTDIRRDGR